MAAKDTFRLFSCQYFKNISGHKYCGDAFTSRTQHAISYKINEEYHLFWNQFFILCRFCTKDVTIQYVSQCLRFNSVHSIIASITMQCEVKTDRVILLCP